MTSLPFIIFQFLTLIFSVIIHEISHGFMAERLGDQTARFAGRLTLNPLRHIDPFGSIILPLILFITHSPVVIGWAKPVPYNPLNLRKDLKYGPLKVALIGPISNFLVLIVVGLFARLGVGFLNPTTIGLLGFVALLNASLAIFNLVPIPPLDGSKILTVLFPRYALAIERTGLYGIFLVFVFLYLFSNILFLIIARVFFFVVGPNVFLATLGT